MSKHRIMVHDDNAIARGVDIELDAICPAFEGSPKGR
jgi:hypothetical protein